jgi:hypothetical protein
MATKEMSQCRRENLHLAPIRSQNPALSGTRPSFHRICGKARGKVNDASLKWLKVLDFLLFAQQLCIN